MEVYPTPEAADKRPAEPESDEAERRRLQAAISSTMKLIAALRRAREELDAKEYEAERRLARLRAAEKAQDAAHATQDTENGI